MRYLIPLCLVSVLLTALPACDGGGDNSVTGVEGSPVAIRLQSVTGGASDFVGEGLPFGINPEGCTEWCLQEDDWPTYVEIMVSVDGGDAETIYNGDYSTSLTITVPNGDVVLLVLIYNCDCCVVFSGVAEMTLPDDGGEVTVEMVQEDLNYEYTYSRDEDRDTYGDLEFTEDLCREATGEEGWVPECLYESFNCDCNDEIYDINPGADEDCDDGIDNDCDGYIDCLDSNCENYPACND